MAEMAVRTIGIRGLGVVPVADDAGCRNQQRKQRQRYPEYPNRLPHGHLLAGSPFEVEDEPAEPRSFARADSRPNPLKILS
jgi:hypothetical protein